MSTPPISELLSTPPAPPAKRRESHGSIGKHPVSGPTPSYERTTSNVLMLGTLLGWGPWSAVIGAFQTYGNSGYTFNGKNVSTSTVHGICQAGQAAFQPQFCSSVDAHYTFGVVLMVVGVLAFVGGMIGLFIVQQHNPRAWRQAIWPIIAGLLLGVFAVIATVIMAIARAIRDRAADATAIQVQPVTASDQPQVPAQSSPPTMSAPQMNVQWRVSAEGRWEWLAADGRWYPQELAPAGLLPPAPPPPRTD